MTPYARLALLCTVIVGYAATAEAEPLSKPVAGPMLLCFKYSIFALNAGERVVDFSGSTEGMRLRVVGPNGRFEIAESEIFANLVGAKRMVLEHADTKVFRPRGGRIRYAIYGPTSFSDGADRLIIWLEGKRLSGTSKDADIYRRFEVGDPGSARCKLGFSYSWTDFLG